MNSSLFYLTANLTSTWMIKPFQTSMANSWNLEPLFFHTLCFSHSLHSEIITSQALGSLLYQNDRQQQVVADLVHLLAYICSTLSGASFISRLLDTLVSVSVPTPLWCLLNTTTKCYAFKTHISWSHFAVQNLPTASYFTDREGLSPYYDPLGSMCAHVPFPLYLLTFCPFVYALLPTLVSDLMLNTPLQNRWSFSLNWIVAIGATLGPRR